jgi:hypothetical protein
LGHFPFREAAKVSADLGLAVLEIGMGNCWASPEEPAALSASGEYPHFEAL